jgi:CD63 antigen
MCFQIIGIIILAVGSSVQRAYNGYHPFLADRFLSLPAFCIATGVIILIIALFGFYGVYKENYHVVMIVSSPISFLIISLL